jgi:diadenosine tetraphosphatase ApaH/serine/threonine PP2A family protein phosphatase
VAGHPRFLRPASRRQPACYALLDPARSDLDDARISFQRVAYDVEAACAALRASELPPLLADRLARRLTLGE